MHILAKNLRTALLVNNNARFEGIIEGLKPALLLVSFDGNKEINDILIDGMTEREKLAFTSSSIKNSTYEAKKEAKAAAFAIEWHTLNNILKFSLDNFAGAWSQIRGKKTKIDKAILENEEKVIQSFLDSTLSEYKSAINALNDLTEKAKAEKAEKGKAEKAKTEKAKNSSAADNTPYDAENVTYKLPANLAFLTNNEGLITGFILDSHQVTLQELSTILNTMKGEKTSREKSA